MTPGEILMSYDVSDEDIEHFDYYYDHSDEWIETLESN